MWRPKLRPFNRQPEHVLRLGQTYAQLWQADGQGWTLLDSRSSHQLAHDQHQPLVELATSLTQTLPDRARIQVLADSKWMPLSMLLTGKPPLSGEQVDTLARHRFSQVFGDQTASWRIQTTYVAGDEQALAFGCPAGLEAGLRQNLKKRLCGLAPTLSWAWDYWRSTAGHHGAWLALAEHDRSILVWLSKGKAAALQPAGPVPKNPNQFLRAMRTEALRCGVPIEARMVYGASFETMLDMAVSSTSDVASAELQWHTFEAGKAVA